MEATFWLSSLSVSSKARNTPGSLNSTAPRARNSIARTVLPQPAVPHKSVGLPFGRPPSVIWSNPGIPVGHFGIPRLAMTFSC